MDDEVRNYVSVMPHFIFNQYEINDQLKDKVKLAVDRSTHASKLRDFRGWMDAVKKDTLHRVSFLTAFPAYSLHFPLLCVFYIF